MMAPSDAIRNTPSRHASARIDVARPMERPAALA